MSTAVDVEISILTFLGLEQTPECQHHHHRTRHEPNDPAVYVIWTRCPKCDRTNQLLLCESGRQTLRPPSQIACRNVFCGYHGGWDDLIILCLPLGGL